MKSQLIYNCDLKEWELLRRFSQPPTANIGGWYILCKYHKKNSIPNCKTIKTIETGVYRSHYVFHVSCSDSLLELTYVKDRFLAVVHFLIILSLLWISCISILSFTLQGLLISFFGIFFCALIYVAEASLRKKAFGAMENYIQTYILFPKPLNRRH